MTLTYIRPDADDTDGTWTNESDSNTNLFASIDETVADDNDYIKSVHLPDHDICKIRLSDPSGMVMRPATVHYRFKKKGEPATQVNLDVSLLQGATEIAKWSESDVGTTYVDGSQALTVPQFNAITDFTNLYLQFDAYSAWWKAGASVDLFFASALYYDSGAGGAGQAVTTYLSCTRASIGYATNSDGTLTQFAANTLRIGVGTGLLVEDARTNLAVRSQEFNTTWSNQDTTETVDTTAAPDGTTTADTITASATFGRHDVFQSFGGIGSGTHYMYSCYMKQGTGRYGVLAVEGIGGDYGAIFDLQTGSVTDTSGGTPLPNQTTAIEALANGWYRCIIGFDAASSSSVTAFVAMSNSATSTDHVPQYSAAGTETIIIWGVQFEAGAFATSYFPTTSSSAARAADNITITSNAQTIIAASTGSIVAQVDNGRVAGVAANVVDSNGTNLLGFNSSNNALASMVATLATSNAANRTTQDKLGIAWDGSGRSLVLNGATVVSDASAQTPSSTQHLGSSGSANFIYAYAERLTIWNSKLADATLDGFTV